MNVPGGEICSVNTKNFNLSITEQVQTTKRDALSALLQEKPLRSKAQWLGKQTPADFKSISQKQELVINFLFSIIFNLF